MPSSIVYNNNDSNFTFQRSSSTEHGAHLSNSCCLHNRKKRGDKDNLTEETQLLKFLLKRYRHLCSATSFKTQPYEKITCLQRKENTKQYAYAANRRDDDGDTGADTYSNDNDGNMKRPLILNENRFYEPRKEMFLQTCCRIL